MKGTKKQQGFTIIELVVVILLLGILTATALPRFMDVTEDAHEAVVGAVTGGLGTSIALYRAQWYADGQPDTVTGGDFDGLVHRQGYPTGIAAYTSSLTANSMTTSNMCVTIWEGLLQPSGRPSIVTKTAAATSLTTIWTPTSAGADFVAYLRNAAGERNVCNYAYVGQYSGTSFGDIPVIQYDVTEGSVSVVEI